MDVRKTTNKGLCSVVTFTYLGLAFLRILLVFPQTGYIHPDEYFQSVEIVTGTEFVYLTSAGFHRINQGINHQLAFVGDIFRAERATVWEFDDRLPIRNVVIPYVFYGIPCLLLKLILNAINFQGTVSPFILLVFPRLMMCLMSFCVDLSLIRYVSKYLHVVTFSNESFMAECNKRHFDELRVRYCSS